LFIPSEIIKREGSKIEVKSKEGEGSTFSFSLPCVGS
jgi:signal transduction histidine kinase